MEVFTLAWRFLLDHQGAPYLVPLPGHLLAVLLVLGLLTAIGLHHLIGYTYGFYRVGRKISVTLAFPSFVMMLASVLVLLCAYALGTTGSHIVWSALASPEARVVAQPIGARLLAPALLRLYGPMGGEEEVDRAMIRGAFLTFSEQELREGFQRQLETARQVTATQEDSLAAEAERREGAVAPPSADQEEAAHKGEEPEGEQPRDPIGTAPEAGGFATETAPAPAQELLMLTLHWLAEGYRRWPPAAGVPEAAGAPGTAEPSAPATEEEETGASPAEPESETQQNGAPATGKPFATKPPAKPAPAHYILSLVDEIPAETPLSRSNWEHVAGRRFTERVLESMLVWQVRYLAVMLVVIVAAANLLFFSLLRQLRRCHLLPRL